MASVCPIVIDVHERRSGIESRLQALGADVSVARLEAGDYDLGRGRLVERKTVLDLHLSLQQGRLWDQIGRVRRAARFPMLLVEGADLDVDGGLEPAAIRGACLAVLRQGVVVLRTSDSGDSAIWLHLLARQVSSARMPRDRPKYAQRPKPPADQVPEAMLAAVPGISVSVARALLERFGSLAGVLAADEHDWLTVPGVGTRRANALREAVS